MPLVASKSDLKLFYFGNKKYPNKTTQIKKQERILSIRSRKSYTSRKKYFYLLQYNIPVNQHGEKDQKQHVQNWGQTLEYLSDETSNASTVVVVNQENRPVNKKSQI